MINENYFVGAVSVLLGAASLLAALFDWRWAYQTSNAVWLEQRMGHRRMRWFYALVGLAFVSWGVAIASGFSLWKPAAAAPERAVLGGRPPEAKPLQTKPWNTSPRRR